MTDKVLVLIPVKEKSVRCKDKNTRLLNNKPLFLYALDSAIRFSSSRREEIVPYVVTESENIKGMIDNKYNILMRPEELADDPMQIAETCLFAIDKLQEDFNTLIMVQPSNPFVTNYELEECYDLFLNNNRTTIRSVTTIDKMIWATCGYDNKLIYPLHGKYFIGNGSIVIIDRERFVLRKTLYDMSTIPYLMKGVDIDNEQDFKLAEILMKEVI